MVVTDQEHRYTRFPPDNSELIHVRNDFIIILNSPSRKVLVRFVFPSPERPLKELY